MSLSPCKVCGCKPFVNHTNISALGCSFLGYVVECTYEEENPRQDLPVFVEHTLNVYGASQEEAEQRWEQLNGKTNIQIQ